MKNIQSIRGIHDSLPNDTIYFQYIENIFKNLVSNYGYHEIRLPILEYTVLFLQSIGKTTDVINKEMYTFVDKNKNKITLRPEGTAGCIRATIQHKLLYKKKQRLFYMGPMFRRERPQKGRYRQFHQLGAEVLGYEGPKIDIELIVLTFRLWKILKINKYIFLEINFIGSNKEYKKYEKELTTFFQKHENHFNEDYKKRIKNNPMRILDTKNLDIKHIIDDAPIITDFLNEKSRIYFTNICNCLDLLNIPYTINPYLVRGLDYYNYTIFEWVTYNLGSKLAICGGGRYNHLIEKLGGKENPAAGFAIGLERLTLLMQKNNSNYIFCKSTDIYIISSNDDSIKNKAILLSEYIRNILPSLQIIVNYDNKNLKKKFIQANKHKTKIVLLLDKEKEKTQLITLKNLITNEQKILHKNEIIKNLKFIFNL
ncbi:MAG: histidine--tRNA ligase [Candidatus Westeberhardia cardiocondylae]|nr:histidine--tRNA ligase [Candidatus Westeberhardia cardiocondylae]